jgi:hypothetical protein
VFERFTDRAQRVVVLTHEEARLLNHNYVGTEHMLLGLIREGQGVAATALESLNISLEAVRNQVEKIIGRGKPCVEMLPCVHIVGVSHQPGNSTTVAGGRKIPGALGFGLTSQSDDGVTEVTVSSPRLLERLRQPNRSQIRCRTSD